MKICTYIYLPAVSNYSIANVTFGRFLFLFNISFISADKKRKNWEGELNSTLAWYMTWSYTNLKFKIEKFKKKTKVNKQAYRLRLPIDLVAVDRCRMELLEEKNKVSFTILRKRLTNVWLHSSVDRASHRHRGGHGFESRWSPDFFQASSFQLLKLKN